jgi:hypothetical protein
MKRYTPAVGDVVWLVSEGLIEGRGLPMIAATVTSAPCSAGTIVVSAREEEGFGGCWSRDSYFETRHEAEEAAVKLLVILSQNEVRRHVLRTNTINNALKALFA